MSETMTEAVKRWTAKCKSALVVEIIQGKTIISEASRTYDLAPSEIESWVDDAKKGMENALKTNPLDVRQEYEKQLKDLQEAYGEAMLELLSTLRLVAETTAVELVSVSPLDAGRDASARDMAAAADIAGLAAEGWNAPLETADSELLGYVNAGTGLGLPGCTPGVE